MTIKPISWLYGPVRSVVFHWAEGDQSRLPPEGTAFADPYDFCALLSRIRRDEDKPYRRFANSRVAGGYCKVKATLRHEDGREAVVRFDVTPSVDSIDVARMAQRVFDVTREGDL